MTTLVSHVEDLADAVRDKLNLMNTSLRPAAITIVVDGGGVVIVDGIKLDVVVPFDCILTGWTILADQIGSTTFDIWKTDYVNAPPDVSNSIVGDASPDLTMMIKNQSSDLTGWTTGIAAGDILRINVSNTNIVYRLTLVLQVMRA